VNWLDYLLAIILLSSAVSGFRRGFSRTIVGLITVVVAVLIASWTYSAAGGFLLEYVSYRGLANIFGFLFVFGGILIAGSLIGRILAKTLKAAGLGWLDGLMGSAVGLIRGVLVSMVIVMLLCAFTKTPPPPSVVGSSIAPYVIDASSLIAAIAPKDLQTGFDESYEKAKKYWKELLDNDPRRAN
jgi:membrane protein required for colicin V production